MVDVRGLIFQSFGPGFPSDALEPPPIGSTGSLQLIGIGNNNLQAEIHTVPVPTPEPSIAALLVLVALGLVLARRPLTAPR